MTAAPDVVVRPLLPDDVVPARESAVRSLRALAEASGRPSSPPTPAASERGVDRVAHLQRTDPDGCWTAVQGDVHVGVALSLRRGPLWFLSLLTVEPGLQGQGVGRRLLDAALRTAGRSAMIMSTEDPKALRRYGSAGFALHPGYTADGAVDRSLLRPAPGVRDGDLDRDAELVERLTTSLRGAPYGPDLPQLTRHGSRLLVLPDRGYAVVAPGDLVCLGAVDEASAVLLLQAVVAEAGPTVELGLVTASQQWAVREVLALRLRLVPLVSLCVRGDAAPHPLHVPGGAYG